MILLAHSDRFTTIITTHPIPSHFIMCTCFTFICEENFLISLILLFLPCSVTMERQNERKKRNRNVGKRNIKMIHWNVSEASRLIYVCEVVQLFVWGRRKTTLKFLYKQRRDEKEEEKN